jgi:hypothetical protein
MLRYTMVDNSVRHCAVQYCTILYRLYLTVYAKGTWTGTLSRGGRSPHGSEKMFRPTLEVSACLAHGVGLYVFIADCSVSVGSNYTIEALLQTLGLIRKRMAFLGKPMADNLHLQLDNTVGQNKNSLVLKDCGDIDLDARLLAGRFQSRVVAIAHSAHSGEDGWGGSIAFKRATDYVSHFSQALVSLMALRTFDTISAGFLRVGHTHEDIGLHRRLDAS